MKDDLFRARDWAGVTQISSRMRPGVRRRYLSKEPRDELASSLVELRASLNSPVLRTGPIADQLVDVWALAKASRPRGGQASRGFALCHGGLRPGERWAGPRGLRPGRGGS